MLNIVHDEAKVFSTKERAPFYICLEVYRPEEDFEPEVVVSSKSDHKINATQDWQEENGELRQEALLAYDNWCMSGGVCSYMEYFY